MYRSDRCWGRGLTCGTYDNTVIWTESCTELHNNIPYFFDIQVGEDVGIYICADSVDGLLERFIEYEQGEGTVNWLVCKPVPQEIATQKEGDCNSSGLDCNVAIRLCCLGVRLAADQ